MEARERIAMKGIPTSVIARGNVVEIWCSSPTGDSSDSVIFCLQCVNDTQAETIAETWRNPFGLTKHQPDTLKPLAQKVRGFRLYRLMSSSAAKYRPNITQPRSCIITRLYNLMLHGREQLSPSFGDVLHSFHYKPAGVSGVATLRRMPPARTLMVHSHFLIYKCNFFSCNITQMKI